MVDVTRKLLEEILALASELVLEWVLIRFLFAFVTSLLCSSLSLIFDRGTSHLNFTKSMSTSEEKKDQDGKDSDDMCDSID